MSSVAMPKRDPPPETRKLSKSSENSCKKKKVVEKKGYTDPKSKAARSQRAARAASNPVEAMWQKAEGVIPPGIHKGVGNFFGGLGGFVGSVFQGGGGGGVGRRM
mmetsp:Transcript_16985/g.43070  ORF Transcript_16985/g.43070 Transcript_16985/m.43070 type:complete len:105 (-) Transcript_16985:40-354(-)|eukprot:jgi/Tetstr1/458188/TSEL_044679.t1